VQVVSKKEANLGAVSDIDELPLSMLKMPEKEFGIVLFNEDALFRLKRVEGEGEIST